MSLDRSQEVNQNYTSKSEEDTDQSQTTLQSPDHLNSQSDQSNNTLVENTERPASEEQPSAFEPPLVENPTKTNFEDKNLLRQFQDNLPTCRNFDNSTDSNLLTRDYSSERNCSNLSSNQQEDEHSERSVDAAYLGRLAVGDTHQDSRPNLSDQKSQLENSDCCSRAQFSDSDNEISNDSSADLSFATSPRADHSITERFRESGNPYETSLPEHEQETSAHTNLRLDTKTEDFLSAAVRQATLQFASKREQVKPSGEDNRASVSPRTPGSNFSSTTAGPTHSPRSGNTENPRASVISGNSGYPPSSNSTSPINFSSYYTYSQDENLRDVFYCHLCSYTGNSKLQFNVHMNTHFEHQCPHCDYTSRTEGRLKRHIKDFHSQVPPDNYSGNRTMRSQPGRPKVYKCKQCQFVSPTKVEFWDHSRSHIKEDKILACPKCPFVTEYKHHLEYHLRNHFGSKPFKCPKCNYSCVNKSMLNSHMKSHTNVYQYRCADCTYATKYCHSLKLHLRKYNHQPATVLNADGSLPTDGSGDFELVSKRGPPRGPRGPKKEARSPPPVLNPSILLPHCGPRGMVPSGFWPLLNHLPNGMHPPPPLIPVSGVHPPGLPNPMAIISPPRLQLPQDKISGSQPINSSSNAIPISAPNPYKCNLCEYSTDNREHLNKHMLTVHAAENQDLFNMFGIHTDSLVDEQQSGAKVTGDKQAAPPRPPSLLQEKSIKTEPTGPMVSSAPMIKVETPEMSLHHRPPHSWPMAEEGKGHEETDGSGSQGSNYHTQGDYPLPPRVQSSSPLRPVSPQGGTSSALDLTHSSPREQYNSMLAHSLAATIEQEALQNGECPLDLTKKEEFRLGVLNVGSLAAAAAAMASYHSPLKRPHPDGAANVSPSLTPVTPPGSLSPGQQAIMASSGSDAAPRKRSRKGKAYKLDTICMKLQERDPSPHADSNDDYYSDYGGDRDAGNNSDDESPDQRPDKMESQDSADGYDSADGVSPSSSAVEHKPKEDGPPGADIDYSKIHDSLRELNGTANVETGQELSTYCSGVDKTSPEVHNLGISPQQTALEHRNSTDGGIPRQDNSALYAGSVSRRKLFVVQQRNEQRLRAEMAQQMANQIASEMTNGWTMEDTLRERDPVTETRNKVVNGMSQKKDCNTFECNYCEIIFKDCVMYTMHMGYHGYHDPFKCNMCGHTSTNKVEFFLHIARAPHE